MAQCANWTYFLGKPAASLGHELKSEFLILEEVRREVNKLLPWTS